MIKARNRLEYTPTYINHRRIHTAVGITSETITAAMGKGQDRKCEVRGQDSFASPTGHGRF